MGKLSNIFWLGTKELHSLSRDFVLLGLMLFSFSVSIVIQAHSDIMELRNASIGIVDEDDSELSHRIARAFLPPYFKPPQAVREVDVNRLMDVGRYTFVIDMPPYFQRDVFGERHPVIQVAVDGTAMVHAGIGSGYVQQIISNEISGFLSRSEAVPAPPVNLVARIAFNPNVMTSWFMSVMGLVNNITMLAIVLSGAAVVRERERGTMDHLLAMPLTPFEIAISKALANGLVIVAAVGLSLIFVVRTLLAVPLAGSIGLFIAGLGLYLFFATSVGIFLATLVRSMPQFGLLFMIVDMPMYLLSGGYTPPESMPALLRGAMQLVPSTHLVAMAQAILYRGAGFDLVWQHFAMIAVGGLLPFGLALLRFRGVMSSTR